jgi:hypothetical protein
MMSDKQVRGGLYGGDTEEIKEQDHHMRDHSSGHEQLKGPQQPQVRHRTFIP